MPNVLYRALLVTPKPKKRTKLPKSTAANKAIKAIPGDDPSRCPTGITTREKLEERVQSYMARRDKSFLTSQGHNYKRMRAFLARLREIRDQKFPKKTVLYLGGPNPTDRIRWPNQDIAAKITPDGIDWEKELNRIDNHIITMEERAHFQKKHGISIYNTIWATRVTAMYLKAVRNALTRKGYQFHSKLGTPDDKYSKHEKSWRFFNNSGDEVVLAMLKNNAWVFDVFHNKTRTGHMVMNQSRVGQKSQGVPISMRVKSFAGVYSPSEARAYKSNWRRTMKWIYQI